MDYKLGGWGIHGYRYIDEPPKKGTGNPKAIPTRLGYASEENKDTAKRVTPTHYIDGVGCVQEATSCNQTELVAVINGMKHVLDSDIQTCILYSDSENTLKGLTQRLPRWKASGWRLGDGEEVKNRSLWEEADLLLSKLNEQAKSITFKHISGHAGHFGNELSDDWARKGNALGVRGINYSVIKETDAQGYWKVDHEPPGCSAVRGGTSPRLTGTTWQKMAAISTIWVRMAVMMSRLANPWLRTRKLSSS